MTAPAKRHHRYSYDEYLSNEDVSNVKHEFVDGEIYAMAGGSRVHAALSVAISSLLFAQLRGGRCVVHSSDLKVRSVKTDLATYPDVTVICGPAREDAKSRHVILNPTFVVEVTSPSSEEWDRGDKLEHYRQMESLTACLLVSHRERRLDLIARGPAGAWSSTTAGPGESMVIQGLGCTLSVDEIYRDVELDLGRSS